MLATPEFLAARCARYRFRYSECRRCADACPHDAIALSDEGVTVDVARCRNCALCTSACRTEALVAGNLPRVELLKKAKRHSTFAFSCAPSEEPGDAVVPCLGALDAAMLAYLLKRGVAVDLRGGDHCAICQHGSKGAQQLELNLEALAKLRGAAGGEKWAAVTVTRRDADQAVSDAERKVARRELFRRLIGRGFDEVAHAARAGQAVPVPEKAIRAGRPFVTTQRELLQLVCKRSDGAAVPLQPHGALPLLKLNIAPGCTACEACFRACPTGALDIRESDTAWALTFQFDRCVGCEVCIEACQPGVLRASYAIDASPGRERATLHALRKQRCGRCDRFFVASEPADTCPVCTDDERAFSEIFG